jgi:very-short-patch-repair endonuclease
VVDGRLAVELDGWAHHSSIDAFRTDRRRGNELTAHGMPLLRFGYDDVVEREDEMVRLVARTLERIGP